MTEYEKLIERAESLGAEVRELNFGTDKKCGRNLDNLIYINDRLSNSEKCEVLAEELAHYNLTVGDIRSRQLLENRKQEFKARRHGFTYIIEPIDIIQAYREGATSFCELAEHIDVTVEYLNEAVEDFKKQYGYGCKVGNYYLMLEPRLGVVKDFGLFK